MVKKVVIDLALAVLQHRPHVFLGGSVTDDVESRGVMESPPFCSWIATRFDKHCGRAANCFRPPSIAWEIRVSKIRTRWKLRVPFGAGDNALHTLRFPEPTSLKMETVAVYLSNLTAVVDRVVPEGAEKRFVVTDRSPALRNEGIGAGDPLGVHVATDQTPVTATVVMSSVIETVFVSVQLRDVFENIDVMADDTWIDQFIEVAITTPETNAPTLQSASELLWNTGADRTSSAGTRRYREWRRVDRLCFPTNAMVAGKS